MDMEFFQFHPTAIRLPGVPPFLISEAVRGEGGLLRNVEGRRFMPDYSPERELAPRDVVTRSILYEMQKTRSDRVFLDITHLAPRVITARFPHIYRFCMEHGLDITKGQIPVAPAVRANFGERALELALTGGEDYELLFTASGDIVDKVRAETSCPVTIIGEVVAEKPGDVVVVDERGGLIDLSQSGWEHFNAGKG